MAKQKTINITPGHYEADNIAVNGKFVMAVYDKNKVIKIHLERFWIEYIASDLNRILDVEQAEINRLRKALKGDKA